ncbi:TetR/AcrR family transcriptional regulator [Streptomyces sp. NBC_01361]|uniref:TetR/AcrR family transcriptional regulator n=1 Tax=Streptomyces sp. NBC_01361 TaxID=2903838 RepID=UPI002E34BDFE|nr:TetR/AcrR family transcriptional regulator [Streptomyces sp. NBC_01361]
MKLTADRIIDAGMTVFAETGYHGFSIRQVAERLHVHAGSLYYHVPNKAALLQLMADRVARQAYDAGTAALAQLPGQASWQTRVTAQAVAVRQSIQEQPGGAIMLAGSPKTLSPGALSLMERLLDTLAEAGVPGEDRGTAADTVLSHVTGYVLQEQSEPPAMPVTGEDIADLTQRFPRTFAAAAAHHPDEKFTRSLDLVCAGIATLIP